LLVVGCPGGPQDGRRHPEGRPGSATTWCTLHFGYATSSGGACADQLCTLESEAVTRASESLWATHSGRYPMMIIGDGITSLVRQCLSPGLPRRRRRPLGRPYRRRGPSPRRPPAKVGWHRWAWPPPRSGGDADAVRAGPGRRQLGRQVGELTLPQGLVLLQAYPLGLHDRRRLIDQARCPCGASRHVAYPLPAMLCPRPSQ
jgi:hypothetical protein